MKTRLDEMREQCILHFTYSCTIRGGREMREDDWKKLGITNNFIFGKVMQNPDICKELLEIILDIKIERIEYPEVEKYAKLSYDGKGVRLDVYVADGKKTVYNVEMQASDTKEIPKRSRYYQGVIDMELIEKGTAYKELNKSYVIFICTFDLFGKGKCRYTFEQRCVEDTSVRLDDGGTRIFLNTKGILASEDISDDMRAFIEYVEGIESDNAFVRKVEDAVKTIKSNEKLRGEYMNQVVRDQLNRDEGIAIGRINLMIKKIQKSKTLDAIADELECTPDEISPLYEVILQCGPECTAEEIMARLP